MEDPLDGLDLLEVYACKIAEHVLGVSAVANDLPPKQGAVDAYLDYADGRRAAFEVTRLASDSGAMQQLSRLFRGSGSEFHAAPGRWFWTVEIGHPRDLPGIHKTFKGLMLLCEELGVHDPSDLRYEYWGDETLRADVEWIASSSVKMYGHPPERRFHDLKEVGVVFSGPLVPPAFVRQDKVSLDQALIQIFKLPHIRHRVAKLNKDLANERHLFIFATGQDLVASLFTEQFLLPGRAVLPGELTHLWLTPSYRGYILYCSPSGWQRLAI
jgi:hypothetical protein